MPFDGTPGCYNAITDVAGVEVGHSTLVSGTGRLRVGTGPVRTGVTAVLPRGKASLDPVFAAWFTLNGNGETTGTTWIEESGFLEGPILITNTHSVGVARDAAIAWMLRRGATFLWAGRSRDLGRRPQRHQWLPREAASCRPRARQRVLRTCQRVTGSDDVRSIAFPHDRLGEILRKYNRLVPPS